MIKAADKLNQHLNYPQGRFKFWEDKPLFKLGLSLNLFSAYGLKLNLDLNQVYLLNHVTAYGPWS